MEACPKCEAEIPAEETLECPACGVLLAKALTREQAEQQRRYRRLKAGSRPEAVAGSASSMPMGQALAVGTAAAVAIYVIPFTRFVLSYLAILVHELGHTAAGFLFGYPSIPSFDFLYGGGITLYMGRSTGLLILVGSGWLALVFALRHWRVLAATAATLAALWLLLALGEGHDLALNTAGHGAELVAAAWFFWKAISGNVRNATERWLYAMCGSFLVLSAWMFAVRLMESEQARAEYGAAKGGGHWMDFSRIARALELDLSQVAVLYMLASSAVPFVAWLVWLNRGKVATLVARTPGRETAAG